MKIYTNKERPMFCIGGTINAIDTLLVPIPFKDLNSIIDVIFQIMKDNIPSLLSMWHVKDNGLDYGIHDEVVKFKNAKQKLTTENYFLVHLWKT